MNFSFLILAFLALFPSFSVQADEEALRECANLHRIDIQKIPNASGEFLNSKCTLKCTVGDSVLSTDSINEGFSCPTDPSGKCEKGLCVGGDAALVECGKLHHLDFKKVNNKGTEYSNNQCSLTCAIDGNPMSTNPLHENSACPGNSKGVCKQGKCVTDGSQPTNTDAPSTEGPVVVTEVPIGPTEPVGEIFSKIKLDEVTFKIKPGKFQAEIEQPYADVCLSDNESLETNFCQQICYSNEISGKTKEPSFSKDCSPMKASDKNYLYVAIYSKVDETFIGSVHQNLNSLFAQHYKSSESSGSVHFERDFIVDYFGKNLGSIGLDITIKFSSK